MENINRPRDRTQQERKDVTNQKAGSRKMFILVAGMRDKFNRKQILIYDSVQKIQVLIHKRGEP